jgi:regulator of protease activity HflC (stomatin/prohibitin superfamily)
VVALIVVGVILVVLLFIAARAIRIIPQARAAVLERFGRYHRTLEPGLTFVSPFIDRVRPLIDLREQVVNFKPQPVITEDNVVVSIETVLYFQITDARAASYEIANPLQAIEQLTVTTLRNVIGGLTLEQTLTSREGVNAELRTVLDEATGKWGIRVSRVEIKSVEPPPDIKAAMEKQMRAERDRRAAILTAEGTKQAAILTAEGEQRAAVLTAEGARQAAILRAEGEAKAIATVFDAIHRGDADQKLLSYQYLQMLPKLAEGDANKVFVIPSEFTQAFAGIADALTPRSEPGGGGPLPGGLPAGSESAPPAEEEDGDGSSDIVVGSDTNIADLLRDSPLAGESAVAGIQPNVEDVLAAAQGQVSAPNGDPAGPAADDGAPPAGAGAAAGPRAEDGGSDGDDRPEREQS